MEFADNDPYLYELLAGELVKRPASSPRHQLVLGELMSVLHRFAAATHLGEVLPEPVDVYLKTKPVNGFSVIGGYSYNQTKYTASNIFIVGSLLRYNPNHTANASVYYAVPSTGWAKGLNVGLTAFYMGERQAGQALQPAQRTQLQRPRCQQH